jgi:DNA-binding LacI/PurR family transcriptional regulator
MANIKDVARMAGVSIATVSRVLNKYPYVAKDKQDKVMAVIKELNYSVNGNAVKLSKGKTNTIGVIVPYNNNCCYDELIDGILKKAHELHYQVLLLPSYYENVTESSYLTLLKKKMIDGILLTSSTLPPEQISTLSEWGKIVCCEACPVELVPSVFPDRFAAYIEVFTYLKNKGYKRIYFTSGREFQSSPSTRLRIQAYQETITETYESQFFDQCFDFQDGKRVGDLMFRNANVPDAIFANGDEIAAGIIASAQAHGYSYPQDFEIIGEENTSLSEILGFPSVDYHQTAIGKQAVSLLLSDEFARIKIRPQLNFRALTEARVLS